MLKTRLILDIPVADFPTPDILKKMLRNCPDILIVAEYEFDTRLQCGDLVNIKNFSFLYFPCDKQRQFSFETFVKSRKYEIQMINESSSTYYIDIYLEIIDKSVKEDIDSYLVNLFK